MAVFRPSLLKGNFPILKLQNVFSSKASTFSYKTMSSKKKMLFTSLGLITSGAAAGLYLLDQSVKASEIQLHAPDLPFYHKGLATTFDHASLRRGFEVYKQVCAACHSLEYMCFRELVNVTHTEKEMKAIAAEYEIQDGPNQEGEMFMRPGRLTDKFPSPYPNEQAAKAANNGSYPPDLSYIVLGRHGGEEYIYGLLTGYCDPPAGFKLQEGLYYNPYFPGQAIGMAQALYDGTIDYEDGTPATASQLAKDVVTFLRFTAEVHHDDRKEMFIKVVIVSVIAITAIFMLHKRYDLSWKTRKIFLRPKS